jgi:hypothetical protein
VCAEHDRSFLEYETAALEFRAFAERVIDGEA